MDENYLRYLKLLNLQYEKPGIEYLEKIVRAVMLKVPFENISKLYYLKKYGLVGIPVLTQYLNGIEQHHFGGTCYSNNYYLNGLLVSLGFDAVLCGADMQMPDVHIVNRVKIEGREFIVDAGYAAPFLIPLPADLKTNFEILSGNDKYILHPKDSAGRMKMELFREGILTHGYIMKPEPRTIDNFNKAIKNSFSKDAIFMNSLLAVHFKEDNTIIISNKNIIEMSKQSIIKKPIKDFEELLNEIERIFKIPTSISRIALKNITMHKDAWG
jgi:arylamine N-acetyltransferase